MSLNIIEASFIGTVLEGVFYGKLYYIYDVPCFQFIASLGLYCIIFVLYCRVHASKKCDDKNILIYPITLLFVLCTVFFALDFTQEYMTVVSKTSPIQPWRWINSHKPPGKGTRRQPFSMEYERWYQCNLFFRGCHRSRGSGTSQNLNMIPGFSSHSRSDIPLLGGMEPKIGCHSYSFNFIINIPG